MNNNNIEPKLGTESHLLPNITRGSLLASGSIRGSYGGPVTYAETRYECLMTWEQREIVGDSKNSVLKVNLFFYHKWDWSSTIYGYNHASNTSVGGNGETCDTWIMIDGVKTKMVDRINFSQPADSSVLAMVVEKLIPSTQTSFTLCGKTHIAVTLRPSEVNSDGEPWRYVQTGRNAVTQNLKTLTTTSGAPSDCAVKGKWETGEPLLITWNPPSSGTVTEYIIEYNCHSYVGEEWRGWQTLATSKTCSYTYIGQPVPNNIDRIQFRVKARNSAGDSGYSNHSNNAWHYGVRVKINGKWEWGIVNVKVSTGTGWSPARTKTKHSGVYEDAR